MYSDSKQLDELNKGFRLQWKKMGGIESLGNKSGSEEEKKFWKKLVYEVFRPLGGLDRFDKYFELIYLYFFFLINLIEIILI